MYYYCNIYFFLTSLCFLNISSLYILAFLYKLSYILTKNQNLFTKQKQIIKIECFFYKHFNAHNKSRIPLNKVVRRVVDDSKVQQIKLLQWSKTITLKTGLDSSRSLLSGNHNFESIEITQIGSLALVLDLLGPCTSVPLF